MLPIPPQELKDVLPDALNTSAGIGLGREPHFLAELFTERTFDPTRAMAEAILDSRGVTFDRSKRTEAIRSAIGTSDFGTVMSYTTQLGANIILNNALADTKAMCKLLELPDSRPTEQATLTVDEAPAGGTAEGADVETFNVGATGETVQVQNLVKNVMYSYQLLMNYGFGIIPETAVMLAMTIARQLGQRFATLLSTNADLSDGVALFATARGNLLTSGSMGLAAFDASAAALRTLTTSEGGYGNVQAKVFLVPPEKEHTARTLAAAINDGQPEIDQIKVVSSAWLTGGNFTYLMGDPMLAPAFTLSTTAGGGGEILRVDPLAQTDFRTDSSDTVGIRVRAASGINAVSHFCVRNTIS